MKNEPTVLRNVFVSAIEDADEAAALIFLEYADLEVEGPVHFESRFGGNAGGFIAEVISVWKSIQPHIGDIADIAGIVGVIIAARQKADSRKTDQILAVILSKLEEIDTSPEK